MNFGLKHTLQADLYRYRAATSRRAFRDAWLREPGFRFTLYLRQVAALHPRKRGVLFPVFAWKSLLLRRYRFRYGFDISPFTRIGPGLYLGHFGGVVISPDAVVGENVNINQGVTIGAASRGPRKGAPVLGDRVWVGANAIVVGKINVGDDVLIAPGAYVNFDVPSHAVVLGNPGQIVSSKGSEGYINSVMPTA